MSHILSEKFCLNVLAKNLVKFMRLNNNFAWDLGLSRIYMHATAAWYWNRFISPVFLSSFLEGLAKRIRIYFHSCFQFNLNHLHPPKFAPTLEFIAPALMLRKCKLKTDKLKVISVRYIYGYMEHLYYLIKMSCKLHVKI